MATHTHHSPDLYAGEDRGRIYRISSETPLSLPGKIRLGDAPDQELVNALASPNIWWRRTAQRLLVDRGSATTAEPLTRLFATSPSPVARLHALRTLEGLGRLETDLIEKALEDPEAGVRENAILLAEPRLSDNPAIVGKLLTMVHDPDRRVQFQLLCTLGGIDSQASRAAQDRLLAQGIDDPWIQIAALSASSDRALRLFRTAAAFTDQQTDTRAAFFRQTSAVIGARRRSVEIRQVLATLLSSSKAGSSWWRAASLDGLAEGFGPAAQAARIRASGGSHARADLGQDLLLKLFEDSDDDVRRASLRVLAATGLPSNVAPQLR